jgi:hypothetical protein
LKQFGTGVIISTAFVHVGGLVVSKYGEGKRTDSDHVALHAC